jgi:hypothetical protein
MSDLRQIRKIPKVFAKLLTKWTRKWIRNQKDFRLQRPKVVNEKRQTASTRANLEPFYHQVEEKFCAKEYLKNLIFNFDETSLLQKKYFLPMCITSTSPILIPQVPEVNLITNRTAALCIAADRSHLPPALILPPSIPSELLFSQQSASLELYTSESGWNWSKMP